jgi:hypothetical protein
MMHYIDSLLHSRSCSKHLYSLTLQNKIVGLSFRYSLHLKWINDIPNFSGPIHPPPSYIYLQCLKTIIYPTERAIASANFQSDPNCSNIFQQAMNSQNHAPITLPPCKEIPSATLNSMNNFPFDQQRQLKVNL